MFSRTGHSLLDESQTRYEGGRSSPGAPHLQMLMTLSMGVLVGAAAVFGASRFSAPVTAAVVSAGGPSTELTGTVSALHTLVADLRTEVGEMKRQTEQRSTKAAAGPEAQPAAATSLSEKGWIPSIPFLQPAALPSKYIVKHTPPVKLQHLRGACWLFGISGVLEASYCKQGIAYGFMQPDEYLRLTEQNLGAQIESACRATTKYWKLGSLNDKAVCFTGDGDTAWKGNSTEGGEAEWIWYLKEWLEDTMALPESVCPYLEKEEGNSSAICEGSEAAIKKSALKMKIKGMKAYYGIADLKRSIFENERYQAFSIALFGQNYPLPCTDATKDYYKCDPVGPLCTKCPAEANYAGVECCVLQARFGTNMKGEFSGGHGGQFTAAGGHAVGYVGWNDNFFSSHGYKGGLIIKNSWWDGVPPPGIECTDPTAPCSAGRGSHSLAYYMEEISSVAEREICPNVHSPASWYACADIATCTSVDSNISAVATRKVLHLECLGDGDQSPYVKGICKAGEKFFFKNMTDFGSGLSVACMVKGDGSGDLCLPPLWDEDLAMLFTPVPEEDKPNDPDQCGYYWFPYEIYGKVAATMEKSYGVDFDIVWPKSAYVNAPKYFKDAECPGCDYEVIKKNTHKQRTPPFTGPFPTLREPLKKE